MAAHVVTGLKDLIEGRFTLPQMDAALSLACWTEDLDFDDYTRFSALVKTEDKDGIIALARELLPRYYSQWFFLNTPTTREAWNTNRFNCARKSAPDAYNIRYRCGSCVPVKLCRACLQKYRKAYPQGWKYYPGDTSVTGVFYEDLMKETEE